VTSVHHAPGRPGHTRRALVALAAALAVAGVGPAPAARAVVVPTEMQHVCINNGSDVLRYASAPACKGSETLATISPSSPILACASDFEKRVRRVSALSDCAPGTVRLTLPPAADPVFFCAKRNDSLRYVTAPSQCQDRELALVVSVPNHPPSIATAAEALSYTEGDPATLIDPALTVADPDDVDLAGATARISAGFQPGDELLFTNQLGITGSYSPGSGVLTLSGTAPVADYQTALRSLRFRHTGDDPVATKTVELEASDGELQSAAATRAIAVAAVHDPPALSSTSAALAYTEGDGPVAIDAALGIGDPDSDELSGATVEIAANFTASQDELAFGGHPGITGSYDDTTGTLTLSGPAPVADYRTALRTVTYENVSEGPSPPGRTIAFTATDAEGAAGSAATRAIAITAVNDPPTAADDTAGTDEDTAIDASAPGVLANDGDPDPGDTKTVTQLDGAPTLTGTASDGGAVSIGADGSYTYDPGTIHQGLSDGQQATATFSYTMEDGAGVESTATVTITVAGVSDAPTASDDQSSTNGNVALHHGTTKPASQAGREVSGSVLGNDTDPDTPAGGLAVVAATGQATTLGGSVDIGSDGTFTYVPPSGAEGATDTFSYTATDGDRTDTGQVSVALGERAWFVENDAGAGGTGRSTDPFDTIAEAETASNANDTVYVFEGDGTTAGLSTGYTMGGAGERLIGEAADLAMDPDGAGPLGSETYFGGEAARRPTLTDLNADVVELGANAVVRGVDVDPAGTGGGIAGGAGDAGATIDDVTVTDTGAPGSQPGIELDGAPGAHTISDIVVATNTGTGVRVNGSGTVSFPAAGTVSIAATSAPALSLTGNTTLDATFDSVTATSSPSGGVDLSNNGGSTTFGDLQLTTVSGPAAAFSATNPGSITVPASGTADVAAIGGPAVDVSGAAGATLAFDDVDSTASVSDGIDLDGLGSGTFSAASGQISGAAGIAFDLDGGSGSVNYPGTLGDGTGSTAQITGRTGGAVSLAGSIADTSDPGGGIALSGNTGGSTTFSGSPKTLSTAAGDAITMTGSDGHTLTLSGGGLDVDTTTGKGLEADASGTVVVTGTGNTIASGSGRALNVSATDIGSGGVTFESISSNGAQNGIRLNATGASGALTVTGTGTPGSGGTIRNSTADGVSLTGTRAVQLARLSVEDSGDDGVAATSVAGLKLTGVTIDGAAGHGVNAASTSGFELLAGSRVTDVGDDADDFVEEHGLLFTDSTGTNVVDASTVDNADDRLIKIVNNGGTTATFNVRNGATLRDTAAPDGHDAIWLQPNDTSNVTLDVRDSLLRNLRASGILVAAQTAGSSSTTNVTFANNTVDTLPASSFAGGSISVNGQSSTTARLTVTDNTFTHASGYGIVSTDANDSSRIDARVERNTITSTKGDAGFVAFVDDGGRNRTVFNDNDFLSDAYQSVSVTGDAMEIANFGGTGTSELDVVATNNTFAGAASDQSQVGWGGIGAFNFDDSTCLLLKGNSITNLQGKAAFGNVEYFLQRDNGTFLYEEAPNTAKTGDVTVADVKADNPPASGTNDAVVVGSIPFSNGVACDRP
jgi:hypothetical protein